MKLNAQIPFWLVTLGALIALLLPRLVQDGMFTDGVLYAAVAHNSALGKGTFWFPYFDKFEFPFFHEQPPLTFAIQGFFFEHFGDSMYVERIYSFGTACISAGLIVLIWRLVNKGSPVMAKFGWLPVLMWITVPVCIMAYSNNLEENTMGVFTLSSVLCIYWAMINSGWKKLVGVVIGAALMVPAFFCKGFPGLFPMAMPVLFFLIVQPKYYPAFRAVLICILTIAIPIIMYEIMLFNNYTQRSMHDYLNGRVFNSIKHVSNVNSRFHLIGLLFIPELLPPFIILLAIILLSGNYIERFKELKKERRRNATLFFFIGLTASFPLIVTKEQRDFYLTTSIPYFALSFAIMAAPFLSGIISKINLQSKGFKIFAVCSLLFVIISLGYSYALHGKPGRDKEKLHDVYEFGKIICKDSNVRVYPPTWQDWGLHNYFVRYFNINLAMDTGTDYTYFLLEKDLNKPAPPPYTVLVEKGEAFDLYKKQPAN